MTWPDWPSEFRTSVVDPVQARIEVSKMATPRSRDLGQPMTVKDLKGLIATGESDLIEFKEKWYDLSVKEGKAIFVKDVLALANTVRPEAPGYLLIGVDDDKDVVGVSDSPSAEAVSQIISEYSDPPVNVHCRDYELDHKKDSVLTVSWAPANPHRSVRDYPEILSSNEIYVRRDRIIGTLTLSEIEARFREKDARLGPLVRREPIQFGFVQTDPSRGNGLVARVSNVTTEPVGGVDVMIDLRNARDPRLFYRARRLSNATLGPGESREVELKAGEITFYVPVIEPKADELRYVTVHDFGRHVGERWLVATLHVDYRDRDGFIRHMEQHVAVEL